ncbi:NUDIX domain-containing protein [Simiduia sp. 21SJ11W-1]|uniref:NUDIX hydrolase n=1 Tax=Simiduia sp. 21SJ11W-1 TaxID=2909669 RepID=UPI0020A0BC5E|nr:NUDIX domain-containing protein [Simiduia sp. 21SJ11W-1]UTA48524.1 NUDIX domain-containing protein [Simiduia sp. 21SJ11W-1]
MAFEDTFRLSSHAVITNVLGEVLLLKATYGKQAWGLPGGALEPGETIHEALVRECLEELGCEVRIHYLSGVYYHSAVNSQAFIFRCDLAESAAIALSHEHSAYAYTPVHALAPVQLQRVQECLNYSGRVSSAKF